MASGVMGPAHFSALRIAFHAEDAHFWQKMIRYFSKQLPDWVLFLPFRYDINRAVLFAVMLAILTKVKTKGRVDILAPTLNVRKTIPKAISTYVSIKMCRPYLSIGGPRVYEYRAFKFYMNEIMFCHKANKIRCVYCNMSGKNGSVGMLFYFISFFFFFFSIQTTQSHIVAVTNVDFLFNIKGTESKKYRLLMKTLYFGTFGTQFSLEVSGTIPKRHLWKA